MQTHPQQLEQARQLLCALQVDLRDVYDVANKNNVAIYAVDPRGLAVNEFDIDQNVGAQVDQPLGEGVGDVDAAAAGVLPQ